MKKFQKLTAQEMQEVNGGLRTSIRFGCTLNNCPIGGNRPHGWHPVYAPTPDMFFKNLFKVYTMF